MRRTRKSQTGVGNDGTRVKRDERWGGGGVYVAWSLREKKTEEKRRDVELFQAPLEE